MSTLTNIPITARSMNGLITLSDGIATLENGDLNTVGTINSGDINAGLITGTSFSTIGKSLLETVLTIATSATPYTWAYNTAQNIVFTGSTTQIFNLPLVLNANLGTTINIYRTSSGGFTINPATGFNLYDWNNTIVNTRGLPGNDRFVTLTAISTGSVQWQLLSQSTNSNLNATLAFSQNFTGLKSFSAGATFTTLLPTTALVPVSGNDLVNKTYADSIGTTLLSSNNVWTGTNAFNTSLPTSTLTPSSNTQLVTKVYADGLPATLLSSNNTWTGTNAFNTSLPTSTLTPSSNTQLVTKVYADALPITLRALNNIWTGTNQFNNNVTMGTAGYFLPYFPLTSTSMRIGLNTLQNSLATSTNCLAIGNGALQGTTNVAYTNLHTNTIAIGNGCMSSTTYGTTTTSNNNNVCIGFDCAKNICLDSNDNVVIGSQAVKGSAIGTLTNCVIIGSKINVNSGIPTYSTIIGAQNFPNTAINYGTIIGAGNFLYTGLTYGNGGVVLGSNNLQFCDAFNNVICIGASSLTNLDNDYTTICIGISSLQNLVTGTGVICLGSYASCSHDLTNTTMLGTWANANSTYHNNALYVGGNNNADVYQDILPAKKNRIYCNQNFSSALEAQIFLEWETADNVVIDNSVITDVVLPSILGSYNIGGRFTLTRSSVGTSSILIDAGTGYFIQSRTGLNQTITWSLNEQYITLVCVSTTTWNVVCNDLVSKIVTTNTTTNATFYPTFVASNTSGAYQSINMDTTLTFNPSTNNLTTTTFTGALVGNATTATTATTATNATNATNVNTTLDTTSTVLYPLMGTATSGLQGALANTNLKYDATTGQLESSRLLVSGINRFAGSYSATGGTLSLVFGDNETIIFDSAPVVTAVVLPSVTASNLGARFTFISRIGNTNRNILASGTELIWDFQMNYATSTLPMNGIGSITLVATGTGNGNNCWAVQIRSDNKPTASVNLISAGINLGSQANLPLRDLYSVSNGATAITIQLPAITLSNIGASVLFRRVATATATVSFTGNGVQFVYNNALTGGATAQAIMTSTTYICKFSAMVVTGVTYAWFQV